MSIQVTRLILSFEHEISFQPLTQGAKIDHKTIDQLLAAISKAECSILLPDKSSHGLFHSFPEAIQRPAEFVYKYVEKYTSKIRSNVKCRKYSDKDILACQCFLQTHRFIDLKEYGISPSTVYERVQRWIKNSVFKFAFNDMVSDYVTECLQKDKSHFKNLITDTTYLKNVQGRDCLGRNSSDRGRNASKFSLVTDVNSAPIAYSIHPGNCPDIHTALKTVDKISCPLNTDKRMKSNLLADKAYACVKNNKFRTQFLERGYRLVVHPKANFRDRYISQHDRYLLRHYRCNTLGGI